MRQLKILTLITIFIFSCKTEEPQNPPTVITKMASDVTFKNATLNGEVTDEGFSATSERGFVYSEKNNNPSLGDLKVQSISGKGIFSIPLNNLLVNTKYHFKAYAINPKGTSYGDALSFTTSDYSLASINTDLPTIIGFTFIDINAKITNDGGGNISSRGFCYSLNPNPTINDNKINLNTVLGAFNTRISALKDNSKYYIRAFAVNEKGVSYSNELNVNTLSYSTPANTEIVEVKSHTGRIWMDRNLGALRSATSINDELAFGFLYQWGRSNDGHQFRNSQITRTSSNSDNPNNSFFIINSSTFYSNWRIPTSDLLWPSNINNPCPKGFRIPTEIELNEEFNTWKSLDANGAFNSILKLPMAGARAGDTGIIENGYFGSYWTQTIGINKNSGLSRYILLQNEYLSFYWGQRSGGASCRCIKE